MVVVFDVLGTLFSLDRTKSVFEEAGLPTALFELWFAELVQSSAASTLAGKYIPLVVLAESNLKQIVAQEQVGETPLGRILESLKRLELRDGAFDCLQDLRAEGRRIAALTNNGLHDTEKLFQQSGVAGFFDGIFSSDDARACKPHPASYQMVFKRMNVHPSECCMVSAHGWDVLGAESAGMNTIYMPMLEKQWPFPGSPTGFLVSDLREIPGVIARQFTESSPLFREAG